MLMICFLLTNCSNQQEQVVVSSQVVEEDPGDVLYTNSTIIIQPTQSQLDSLQQKVRSSDFNIGQDDYVFYANAMSGFFFFSPQKGFQRIDFSDYESAFKKFFDQ
jgi:hypothetical protein